jgi:predicted nuclease of predicted toxin-antitoxin system
MKLLLDENLSRRIVPFIQELYPSSIQVALVGLEQANDKTIRQYAIEHDFVIVTKDADFYEMNRKYSPPPL